MFQKEGGNKRRQKYEREGIRMKEKAKGDYLYKAVGISEVRQHRLKKEGKKRRNIS